MANRKIIDIDVLTTLLDNITIAGADGFLTFNDGVEFCKDLIMSIIESEEVTSKDIKQEDTNITQEVIETIKRGELND